MTHRFVAAALLVTLAGAAFAQAPAAAASASDAPPVTVQPFEQVALKPLREAPAIVVPRNEARVAAEVAARVLRWTVDTGGTVARGALLVELDPTDLRLARDRASATLEASQARLKLAEAQLARARELVAQGFFSQEALASRETEVQLMRSDVAANRAQLATAERALAKTRISAPFAASVKERLAQAGEYVSPGTPLYVLTQTDTAEVSAQVPLADVDGVRASSRIAFVTAGREVALKLLRAASTVTAPARTVELRLAPQAPLVIGAQGQLRWQAEQPHVPANLLVMRERRLGVFVVERGRATFVPLPGAQEGRAAPAAIAPQTLLVTSGQAALRDGQPVNAAR